ncbi:MAG: hypothetical protein KC656_06770 [Myxococcales bacterium]|nr:hypothetical protein [Myxococcales bacterium]MCB9671652.1 hypothetical protein [Alphaproteobacteria bacterium]MCB9693151.1 hypothetical protein [Alphaproteobacteria bacterium]
MLFFALFACSRQDRVVYEPPGPAVLVCDACIEGEICLVYLDGTEVTGESCEPPPDACADEDGCACSDALYDLCEEPHVAVDCADTTSPTIISCNL